MRDDINGKSSKDTIQLLREKLHPATVEGTCGARRWLHSPQASLKCSTNYKQCQFLALDGSYQGQAHHS